MSGPPPRVWDNRDRFFEPTGTTRASIVGATRPPFGYYSEFPHQLVGFADSIRRLFLVLWNLATGPSSGQLISTRVGGRRFLSGHEAKMARAIVFNERIVTWGTELLKGRREVDTKPKWLERLFSTKE